MIELKENDAIEPICPHCSQPPGELWFKKLHAFLGRRYVYFCSKCRKVLGISHRKRFWMG